MAVFGYGRVSTTDKGQTTENQRKVMAEAGFTVTQFFSEEGVSGSTKAFDRPTFKAMIEQCQPGDTIIVTMLDRLGRSTIDVLSVAEALLGLKIKLVILQFGMTDLASPMGKMMLGVMAACAELERNILIERTHQGLARTKAEGTKLGRPMTIEPATLRKAIELNIQGYSWEVVAAGVGAPKSTLHRTAKEWAGKLDEYDKEWMERKTQYLNNGK